MMRCLAAVLLLCALGGCYASHERGLDEVDAFVPEVDASVAEDASEELDAGGPSGLVPTSGVIYLRCAPGGEMGLHIAMPRSPFEFACGDPEPVRPHIRIDVYSLPAVGGSREYSSGPPVDDVDAAVATVPHVIQPVPSVDSVVVTDFRPGVGATVSWSMSDGETSYVGGPTALTWCDEALDCD